MGLKYHIISVFLHRNNINLLLLIRNSKRDGLQIVHSIILVQKASQNARSHLRVTPLWNRNSLWSGRASARGCCSCGHVRTRVYLCDYGCCGKHLIGLY